MNEKCGIEKTLVLKISEHTSLRKCESCGENTAECVPIRNEGGTRFKGENWTTNGGKY
jgi:hypothetical protein